MAISTAKAPPVYNPTPYKISTITATGSVNTAVKLDILFENVALEGAEGGDGIVYAEFGSRKSETIHKGHAKKLTVAHRKHEGKKKRFDNQVTLVFRYTEPTLGTVMVNSKIFKNGHVQMTGLKFVEQGVRVVDLIIETLRAIAKVDPGIVEDANAIKNVDYQVRLINCDFKIGFEIRRDKLHTLMTSKHGVMCSFEPCIYPGCKIQYCYNRENPLLDGICRCSKRCTGKACGSGDGNCKKITIAVFQSGCIIITGGQTLHQIQEAYQFVGSCIRKDVDFVYKRPIELPPCDAL